VRLELTFIYNLDKFKSSKLFLRNSKFPLLERCHISDGLTSSPHFTKQACVLLTTRDNCVYNVTSRNAGLAVYAMICHASQNQPFPVKKNYSDTLGTTSFLERRTCRPSREVCEHLSHQRTRFAMFQPHTQMTKVL